MKTNTIISKLLKSPPCEWEGIIDRYLKKTPASEVGSVSRAMDDDCGRLAYLSEYLAQRSGEATCGNKEDHKTAASRARRQCVRVNKALGYTFAERRTFNL